MLQDSNLFVSWFQPESNCCVSYILPARTNVFPGRLTGTEGIGWCQILCLDVLV